MLTHLSKTNAFYRRPSVISKSIFFFDIQHPSPPIQCCNTLRGHFDLVTTLKGGEGVEMLKLDMCSNVSSMIIRSVLTKFYCFVLCLDVLLPVISRIVNLSLSCGHFPDEWKEALVTGRSFRNLAFRSDSVEQLPPCQ